MIQTLRKLKQEACEFKLSLGNIMALSQKQNKRSKSLNLKKNIEMVYVLMEFGF